MVVTSKHLALERVTPKVAKEWLGKNQNNRPLSQSAVDVLVEAIRNDEWVQNGEAIKFSASGVLIDGQHRLEAIVQTGRTLEMVVVRGLEEESFNTIDQGRKRSFSDMLARDGETNANHLAVAVRYYWIFGTAPLARYKVKRSIPQLYTTLEGAGAIRSSVATVYSWHARILGSVGILAGCYHRCRSMGAEYADEFWAGVCEGEDLSKSDPAYKLRRRLLDDKTSATQDKMGRATFLCLLVKCWNAYAEGGVLESLRLTSSDQEAKLRKVR